MLAIALMVLGGLLVLAAFAAAMAGVWVMFLPQLLIVGVILLIGLAIERWRYKPLSRLQPDPSWKDTGERFVDPESGLLTAVYFDPQRGERHYIVADDVAPLP